MSLHAVALFAVLAAVALLFGLWVGLSGGGLRFAWGVAQSFVPGTISVERVEGRLVGPLVVERFELELAGFRVRVARAEIEWSAGALARRRIDIESLRIRGFELSIPASTAGSGAGAATEIPASIRLPLDVAIGSLVIEEGAVRAGDDAPLWSFARLALGARLDERLRISDLALSSAELDLAGRLDSSSRRPYAGEATLDWTVRPVDLPALTGSTRVSGSTERLTVIQSLAAPYGIDADISVSEPFAGAQLGGELRIDMQIDALGRDLPVEHLGGRVDLGGRLDELALSGALQLAAPELVDTDIDFEARYRRDEIDFGSLLLESRDTQSQIRLAGRVGLAGTPEVELRGTWTALQWPLSGPPRATSPTGRLELTGSVDELRATLAAEIGGGTVEGSVTRRATVLDADLDWVNLTWQNGGQRVDSERGELRVTGRPDDYRLTLDADLLADPGTSGHLRVAGRGSQAGFELERIDLAVLGGSVEGSGGMSWDTGLEVRADLELSAVDPRLLAPGWPGSIDGRVAARARLVDGALSLRASEIALRGMLRDRPFVLDALGSYATPFRGTIDRLELRLGAASLTASGVLGSVLDVEWNLDSPQLDDLWPGLAGGLATTGRLGGPRDRPILDVDARAVDLALGDYRAARVELATRLDTSGSSGSDLELHVSDASVQGRSISSVEITGAGDAASQNLHATLEAEGAMVDLDVGGRFEANSTAPWTWSFDLVDARVEHPALGAWRLREPTAGRLSADSAMLEPGCWQRESASLCAGGTYGSERSTASFMLGDLPLALFAQYLPVGTTVVGTIDGTGALELAGRSLRRLDAELATSAGWIGTGQPDTDAGLGLAPGSARVEWTSDRLDVALDLPLATSTGGVELVASAVGTADRALADSALEGNVRVAVGDMGFVAALTREISEASGALSADLRLAGTVAAPRLIGRIDVSGGTARLSEPGILLEEVVAELRAEADGRLSLTATASSGGGMLNASGSLRFDENFAVGQVAVTGESFEVIGTPTLRVLVSPELRMALTPARVELTGRLFVPTARITPPDLSEGVARVSPDEIILDEDVRSATPLLRPLYATVELELGDDVTFDGLGLTGRLTGGLQIAETPNEPASGSGELRIEQGTYEAYRQTLNIRTGRLIFAGGALTRPGIDIEAVRQPTEDILVGARVRGTLEQPELTLFSEPAMPRQEQLSYLLIGRPLERASSDESSALSQAALLLGLSGSDVVTDRLNRSLGFDQFGIEAEPGETSTAASFVIGRYLVPSLYVSYGIGLFEQVNTLRLRYTISERWRLETESSSESAGGDVIFHLERGP